MSIEEFKENALSESEINVEGGDKKPFKREKGRFEFALFINDFLVCKRNFHINGYIDKSMQSLLTMT